MDPQFKLKRGCGGATGGCASLLGTISKGHESQRSHCMRAVPAWGSLLAGPSYATPWRHLASWIDAGQGCGAPLGPIAQIAARGWNTPVTGRHRVVDCLHGRWAAGRGRGYALALGIGWLRLRCHICLGAPASLSLRVTQT